MTRENQPNHFTSISCNFPGRSFDSLLVSRGAVGSDRSLSRPSPCLCQEHLAHTAFCHHCALRKPGTRGGCKVSRKPSHSHPSLQHNARSPPSCLSSWHTQRPWSGFTSRCTTNATAQPSCDPGYPRPEADNPTQAPPVTLRGLLPCLGESRACRKVPFLTCPLKT